MGTEDNPDIWVEYSADSWPPSNWTQLLSDCADFSTSEAGIHKVSTAEVTLKNKAGYYTSGANKLARGKFLRIRADVRGTEDRLFYGKIYRMKGHHEGAKLPMVTLSCYGLDRKLLEDTITKDYREEYTSGTQSWTMKTVIENFLSAPDTLWVTGITLETDNGIITTTEPLDNCRKTTLFDAIKQICEKIGYDGYFYVDASNNQKLVLKGIGTVAASPSVTLSAPFVLLEPDFTIEPVGNHIFIWGGLQTGLPPDERWTEKDILTNWTAYTNCTIKDEQEKVIAGEHAMRVEVNAGASAIIGGTFTVPTGESPIDCTKLVGMSLDWRRTHTGFEPLLGNHPPAVILWDDAATPNKIRYNAHVGWTGQTLEEYHDYLYPVNARIVSNVVQPFFNNWYYIQGSTFSWKVKKIELRQDDDTPCPAGSNFIIDDMYFQGGTSLDPLKYRDELTRTDEASATAYGRKVLHEEDQAITNFEQGGAIADYVLACNKDELKVITVKKGAKTWVHTNQYVTLNVPEWDISSELWRTLEVNHEWSAKSKLLRTTMKVTPKDQRIGTQAYLAETLEGLIARWG